jgi:hypothetical protein
MPTKDQLKDGESRVVPMEFRDTINADGKVTETAGFILKDALGDPLPAQGGRRGYVFGDAASFERREAAYQRSKADLSVRYKGGLETGDTFSYGDTTLVVTDATEERLRLSNINFLDGEQRKRDAYEEAKRRTSNAWKQKTPSDREFEMAGPLSDNTADAQSVQDAHAEMVRNMEEAWRK